jgi:hypothetical protein
MKHHPQRPLRIVIAELAADHVCGDGQQTASATRPSVRRTSPGHPPFGHVVTLNTPPTDLVLLILTTA